MIHLGDITKIHGDEIEPVDCITFGSPCQDLSIAGRRAGLAGERSGLFMEAVRIIKEMRSSTNGLCPTFAIWENVPGAFSSNNGEDFRAVLEELARIGQPNAVIPRPPRGGRWSKAGAIAGNGWSLAWRQLDSQYFGVAQRRKRIALILDLGGQRAGEILFERTSLSRHPDPCIPAWKEVTGLTANRPAGNDRVVGAGCCCKSGRDAGCGRTETDRAGKSEAAERTSSDKCCEAAAYTLKIRSGCAGGGKGALVQTEKTGTLSTLQDQTLFQLIQEPTYCISGNMVDRATKQNGMGVGENISFTMDTVNRHAVAIEYSGCLNPWDTQARRVYGEDGAFPALPSRETAGGNQQAVLAGQRTRWIVRRLTPTECERLQGYPDGWTDIGEWTDTKGKKHKPADSPRYKALGNSIALPQWFWIAQKMKSYMGDGAKLGSLFDGIGGFPLVWETTYGIGTARWASEIEEFPIAVTKKHFPERKEYEN